MKKILLLIAFLFPLLLSAQASSHQVKAGLSYGSSAHSISSGLGPLIGYEYIFLDRWSSSVNLSYVSGESTVSQNLMGSVNGIPYDNTFTLPIEEQSYLLDFMAHFDLTGEGLKLGLGASLAFGVIDYPNYIFSNRGMPQEVRFGRSEQTVGLINLGIHQDFPISDRWSFQLGGILRSLIGEEYSYTIDLENVFGGTGRVTNFPNGASLALNAVLAYHF